LSSGTLSGAGIGYHVSSLNVILRLCITMGGISGVMEKSSQLQKSSPEIVVMSAMWRVT